MTFAEMNGRHTGATAGGLALEEAVLIPPKQPKDTRNRQLLDPHELAELAPPEAIRIPLDLVDANPANPRRALAEIPELAASIKEFGMLQPITVRRIGDRYEILGGHRRRAAVMLLAEQEPLEPNWKTIAAVVRTFDDDRAYLALLAGQLQSKSWNPKEEAAALERLAETRTLKVVGALVHKGENWVSRRLRIYADSVLSAFVQTGKLPAATAEELLLVPEAEMRREYAERAVAEQWSAAQARAEVRKLKTEKVIRDLDRRVLDLLSLLSSIPPTSIPVAAFRNLGMLRGRIDMVADAARGGGKPVFPTIEHAAKVAGVKPGAKPTKQRRTRLKID